MLDPHFAFSAAGTLAMLCWVALAGSLFLASLRERIWLVTGLVYPVLIGIAYILLVIAGFGTVEGGGFGSIAAVRALFSDDSALAAGWLHYLAFDLFVGTWIAREGLRRGVPRLAILPCLPLTFLFGPAGLVLFALFRLATTRREAVA